MKTNKTPLDYFYEICAIPHGSGNTGKIADYCVSVAKEFGLYARKDESNNVVIKKDASADKIGSAPVIIQGHLDMVCAKLQDSDFDFLTDGIKCITEGDYIRADNTTLGADDGIAVAYALALISDDSISHPPLEIILTSDEEVGLIGATNIDVFDISAKQFINIDSEKEGIFTVSCAGGVRVDLNFDMPAEDVSGKHITIAVTDLVGGHSGVAIHKGSRNANKVIGEILNGLKEIDFNILAVNGGDKDNAIAAHAKAEIVVKNDDAQKAEDVISKLSDEIKKNSPVDPDIKISVKTEDYSGKAASLKFSSDLAKVLYEAKNGVVAMDENIPNLVKTSLNLGVVSTTENSVNLTFALRSNDNNELENLKNEIKTFGDKYGAKVGTKGEYPAWEYKPDSRIREVMCDIYKEKYGKDPVVVSIHAGLECGLFSEKLGGIDAVSIGADVYDIHSVKERMSISSLNRVWEFLKDVLKKL